MIESGDRDEMADITFKVSILMMAASVLEVLFCCCVRSFIQHKIDIGQNVFTAEATNIYMNAEHNLLEKNHKLEAEIRAKHQGELFFFDLTIENT